MSNEAFLDSLKRRLPKIPGIHGKEEYFNSVVLALLVEFDDGYHLLFEKRAPDIRQGGEICFPGGEYDPARDAGLWETALREAAEEIGLPADKTEVIGVLDTMVAPMGTTVDVFVGVADIESAAELVINPVEVADIFTVPVSWFIQHRPEAYQVGIEIYPSYSDETGNEVILLPSRELGLPGKYTLPWSGRRHKILVYRTAHGVIWGITARLVYDLVRRIP